MDNSQIQRQENNARKPLAIYIHWPFCKKKCPYCDFNSHVRAEIDVASFQAAYLAELRHWRTELGGNYVIGSIFFGGGTPSLMPPETTGAILDAIAHHWPLLDDCEITLEANPTSVEAQNFQALSQAGVNRVSLGIQSLRQEALAFLGREHSVKEALKALETAQRFFARTSFDLIYALPNQREADWRAELQQALAFGTQHLSLYQLTIEENTAFHHAYHVKKQFLLPDETRAAALYQLTQQIMQQAHMPAYEISNHAKAGEASRHNLTYWRAGDYLGIGAGAHGRIALKGKRYATENIRAPERWLDAVQTHSNGLQAALALTPQEMVEEQLLMGLRLVREGLHVSDALYPQLQPAIHQLVAHGLLTQQQNHICVTDKGALLVNYVTFTLCDALG